MESKLIIFFKKHNLYKECIFNFIYNNITYYNYDDKNKRVFNGCLLKVDENNILKKVHITVPYIVDYKTLLINIHEFVHMIELYYYLNKEYIDNPYKEVLPMFFEKLYVLEDPNLSLDDYNDYIDKNANWDKEGNIIGKELSDKLLQFYDNECIVTLRNKVRKLSTN